jgi:hypothetical protein
MIVEKQSWAFDIRDTLFNQLRNDPFFAGYTCRPVKMLPVLADYIPYLGVYLIDEDFAPDGDGNATALKFSHTAKIGFSVIILNNDAAAAEATIDQAYNKILALIFCDPFIFNVQQNHNAEHVGIESQTRGRRKHNVGAVGANAETPYCELQYDATMFFRTEWYPDITNELDSIYVTTGVKWDDTQQAMSQRQQAQARYLNLYTGGAVALSGRRLDPRSVMMIKERRMPHG